MKLVVTLGIIAAGVLVGGIFLGYSMFVYADRDDNDENVRTGVCDPSHVQHWDKIMFTFRSGGHATGVVSFIITDPDGNIIEQTSTVENVGKLNQFDVKVLDDSDEVSNLEAKVLEKLEGYTVTITAGNGEVISRPIQETNINIFDVEYAIVCAKP